MIPLTCQDTEPADVLRLRPVPSDVQDASEQAPQGNWAIRYAGGEGKVTASLLLELKGGMVAPQDYAAFRSFLGRLDQALSRKVEAAPPARTAVNEAR